MFGINLIFTFLASIVISDLDADGKRQEHTIQFQFKRLNPEAINQLVKERDDFYATSPTPAEAVTFDTNWLQKFVTGWKRPGAEAAEPLPEGEMALLVGTYRMTPIIIFTKYNEALSGAISGN